MQELSDLIPTSELGHSWNFLKANLLILGELLLNHDLSFNTFAAVYKDATKILSWGSVLSICWYRALDNRNPNLIKPLVTEV